MMTTAQIVNNENGTKMQGVPKMNMIPKFRMTPNN